MSRVCSSSACAASRSTAAASGSEPMSAALVARVRRSSADGPDLGTIFSPPLTTATLPRRATWSTLAPNAAGCFNLARSR